jgi:hypothetical protein
VIDWIRNGLALIYYNTRRLFTPRATLVTAALLGGWTLYVLKTPMGAGEEFFQASLQTIFPVDLLLAILFGMTLLPREKESGTVEVFFSLPVSRFRLIVWRLVALCLWLLGLLVFHGIILLGIEPQYRFSGLFLHLYVPLISVSFLTVWFSTLTRSAPTAGFLAAAVCFFHLFQFPSFGPVQLFQSPFLTGSNTPMPTRWDSGNVMLVGLICIFLLVQINERLKKSELWLE